MKELDDWELYEEALNNNKGRGRFKKILGEPPVGKGCNSPEHRPPTHIVLEPGVYEYTCPVCGQSTNVYIGPKPTL